MKRANMKFEMARITCGALLIALCLGWSGCGDDNPVAVTPDPPVEMESGFVTANGVSLHYLDWPAAKENTILFLAGLGNTAHVWEDFAPEFTKDYRVLALTRRGYGESGKPATGYDTGTLTEDVRAFLDAMGVERVTLVGHSLAGDELTRFASLYPDRVSKLVYLDAAYDRRDMLGLAEFMPVDPDAPVPDLSSEEATRVYLQTYQYGFWSDALETEMLLSRDDQYATPPLVFLETLVASTEAEPDYSLVTAPALAIYTKESPTARVHDGASQEYLAAMAQWYDDISRPYAEREIARFRDNAPRGTVVMMKDTHHYLFIHKEAEVLETVHDFLSAE